MLTAKNNNAEKEPELFFDAMPIWNAFRALSSSRNSGFSIGYIPFSEISDWLSENDIISLEERRHYRQFITFIDEIWVSRLSEKQSKKQKLQQPPPKKRR